MTYDEGAHMSSHTSMRKLDIDDLFAELDEHELTAAEIAARFAISKTHAHQTLYRLAANGELLWTWDSRTGRGRRARRYRPSYIRPHEQPVRGKPRRRSLAVCAPVIQLLHRRGELTIQEVARALGLSEGYVSTILASLVDRGRASYRNDQRGTRGQPKRIYRLISAWPSDSMKAT